MHSAGHTYSNLSRLFIRLFVGIMFLQFGVRQIMMFDVVCSTFPGVWGMSSSTSVIVMIVIEIGCSLMIMAGFLTRIATIPPIISMIVAENLILNHLVHQLPYNLMSTQPGFLPIMFIGIFFYIILAGPGKISVDYLLSLHFLSFGNNNKDDEDIIKDA